MIRLLLSSLIVLVSVLPGSGQTQYWAANFTSPAGWALEDNWSLGGGSLLFDWSPTIYNFDQSATSPVIELDNNVTNLIISQYLQVYNPSEEESAQLIISSEGEDTVIWEYNLSEGDWGINSGEDIMLPLETFAGQSIQVKFRTFGFTTFNWSMWQVFSVKIMAEYNCDLFLSDISGPKNIDLFQAGDWVVEVSNRGSEPVSGYTVNLIDSRSGNIVDNLLETGVIDPGQNKMYGFSWAPDAAYNTAIYGKVVAADDQFSGNDLSKGNFLRIEPEMEYSILVWDNDNGIQSIQDPEKGDMVRPLTGLTRAMDGAGLEYEVYTYLPDDLDNFDIVIATLGCYCLS